ncbi:hypothetical protein CBR_g30436 [Chara braunii]|uniref:Uncharacterized protein n=1 Tax=Chara braunii TaxID=69332 RepID=A0A388LCN4_CHABU|nr:hypothetical protein CBR_g30436 [Chara braunii]|eukprot:GBG80069.1 hypothetical protein CBR_g30436 [Chara braunii]
MSTGQGSLASGLGMSDIFLGEDGGDDGVVSADGEVLPVEVQPPDCERVNHGEEFLLVGGVIHLRGKEFLACEGDGVFARCSFGVSGRVLDGGGLSGVTEEMLGHYGSDGEVGGVSGDIEMASGVSDLEDRGRGDGLLETSPMGGLTDAISMPGQCPGNCVHDEEGTALAEGGDVEVAGRVEADWRVHCVALGQLVCWWPNWRQRKQPPFAWRCGKLVQGRDGGGVFRGDVMEKAGAGGGGRETVMGVEESIVVKHAREEVSKGHVGFVGKGGCKIFVAYSFDAGDECKVGNDGGGEVVAEGADILDEAVRGTGLAEVAELFKVVINGFLGAKGGGEKVGPLEEGVTWSSGGSAVVDFSHPPFGGIAEEAGGGNREPVGKGHVVEVKRVLELG